MKSNSPEFSAYKPTGFTDRNSDFILHLSTKSILSTTRHIRRGKHPILDSGLAMGMPLCALTSEAWDNRQAYWTPCPAGQARHSST